MPSTDTLALIDHRLSSIESGYVDLRDAIKDLAAAINKLAIIDERQVQSAMVLDKLNNAVDKAHSRIDSQSSAITAAVAEERKSREDQARVDAEAMKALERRVDALEKSDVENRRVRNWAFGLVTLLGVAVAGGLLRLIGLSA